MTEVILREVPKFYLEYFTKCDHNELEIPLSVDYPSVLLAVGYMVLRMDIISHQFKIDVSLYDYFRSRIGLENWYDSSRALPRVVTPHINDGTH